MFQNYKPFLVYKKSVQFFNKIIIFNKIIVLYMKAHSYFLHNALP